MGIFFEPATGDRMMLRELWHALWSQWRERHPVDDGGTGILEAGIAAATRGDHDAARRLIERFTSLHPEAPEGWNALGNVSKLLGDLGHAASHYRKALELEPGAAGVWANLGMCLRSDGRTTDALAALERALELDRGNAEAAVARAAALSDCARYEEAESSLRALLAEHPEQAQAHALLAHILLLSGRFPEGWAEYEWRWRLAHAEALAPLPIPQWDGSPAPQALLLIRAEQALGDQIMLASCVPDAAARAGEVWLECDSRLVTLFAGSFRGVRVFAPAAWMTQGRTPDLQIPLGSLPKLLRRRLADFPSHSGYLRADPERVARWRTRLGELGRRPHIGISWRGGALSTRQRLRSIPLRKWGPILDRKDALFVNLQYGPCDEDLAELRTISGAPQILHFPEAIADYGETAALVAALDLVISVQTAVVHLAGALGRPTWVLVAAAPEWRYMAKGERMPWYPSVRLFRQRELGDWDDVIVDLALRLERRPDANA